MSKTLSKYIAAFDYFYRTLLLLFATSGAGSIASFVTAIGTPVGMTTASLSLVFLSSNRVAKTFIKQ